MLPALMLRAVGTVGGRVRGVKGGTDVCLDRRLALSNWRPTIERMATRDGWAGKELPRETDFLDKEM